MQYYKVKDGRLRYIFVFYWTPKIFFKNRNILQDGNTRTIIKISEHFRQKTKYLVSQAEKSQNFKTLVHFTL